MARIGPKAAALALAAGLSLSAGTDVLAGKADVVKAEASRSGDTWTFTVTVAHADTGWDHYADKWDVVDPHGNILATRTLYHPHVTEQPFTRSLSGVRIPDSVLTVIVRAHDSVHGYGGAFMKVQLPR